MAFLSLTVGLRARSFLRASVSLLLQNGSDPREGPKAPTDRPSCSQTSPAVLVPGFDLRVSEVERGSQLHAVLHTQVFLPLEATLQLRQLMVSEGGARFPWLFQAHRGTVPRAGYLAVTLLLHCGDTEGMSGLRSACALVSHSPLPKAQTSGFPKHQALRDASLRCQDSLPSEGCELRVRRKWC